MSEGVDTLSLPSNICEFNNAFDQLESRPPSANESNRTHQTIMKRQKEPQLQLQQRNQQQLPAPLPPLHSTQYDENPLTTSSSIIEFLNHEQKCLVHDNDSELDIDSIFEEINRLSDDSDERSVDEILREAEILLSRQEQLDLERSNGDEVGDYVVVGEEITSSLFEKWKIDEHLKPISEESTPRDMKSQHSNNGPTDEITINKAKKAKAITQRPAATKQFDRNKAKQSPDEIVCNGSAKTKTPTKPSASHSKMVPKSILRSSISSGSNFMADEEANQRDMIDAVTPSDSNESENAAMVNGTHTDANGIKDDANDAILRNIPARISPNNAFSTPLTPISMTASNSFSWTRERALEQQIENLRETLKDTEERLQSLRLQYDNVSQMHRKLRDTNNQMHEEMDRLKIDAQHLRECANILRTELQAARKDRADAIEVQKALQRELDDSRAEKRKACDDADANAKQILDLQRQCKEMERIMARKNPDAMSSLLVGSKKADPSTAARRMLEQRIAQLEQDAREQDRKAQLILANVQSRFSSVQSKYETHISDLETQVLSLQQINTILNEKIEAHEQMRAPNNNNYILDQQSCATQTEPLNGNHSVITASVFTQTDAKSTPPTPTTAKATAIPKKVNAATNKEETHLLTTVRGMRVDLAIKEKAMQRLTRELDECKKAMKKMQKERDAGRVETKPTANARKPYDPSMFSESWTGDSSQLQESLNKIKLLECDYKSLHEKRLQDLKTLQTAHEREMSANKETVRLLEQRLAERDEAFAIIQKHHKIPIDYFALKAKVTSLERRHTEREQRLHILVEALSKGRLNGSFEGV